MVQKSKTVGQLKSTPLQRFGRLQRRVALVAPEKAGRPKGVQRFHSYSDIDPWPPAKTQNQN